MDWETVEKNIKKECNTHKKSSEYIRKYIAYSKKLFDNKGLSRILCNRQNAV